MKSTVEQLSPTRVKINVEVPFDELKSDFDRAYKKIAQQVNIPGFRPGKAPARILEQRLGRGVVIDEVVNAAVPAKYAEIVNAGTVRPLGRPDIEVTKIEDGDHLAFTAEVDVRPDFEMPTFSDFAVSVDEIEVTDDEVEEQLNGLRSRFGTLVGVDRPIQQGDFIILDLSATVDGEQVEEAATTGLSYEVGSGRLVDGIDEALIGAQEGEERTFTTTLVAGEYAGREAEATVRVGSVKERELPEADDEFAQLASEFDTLEELREDLRGRLGKVKANQQAAQARDKVMEALLAAIDVPLPEALIEEEIRNRMHDALQVFEHNDQRFSEWLAEQDLTAEQFEADLAKSSRDVVKARLVLDAIADAEELSVSETELMERIILQAQRYGIPPNEYVQQAQAAGELGSLYAELRRNKALGTVMSQTTMTDSAGNVVDLAALLGQQPQQPADTTEEQTEAADEQAGTADEQAETADDQAGTAQEQSPAAAEQSASTPR